MAMGDSMTLVDGAVIAFMAAGAVLFLALTVGVVVLAPRIRRILGNLEKASRNAAVAWENLAPASESVKAAAEDLARLARTAASESPGVVEKVKAISEDVKATTARVAEASKLLGLIGAPQDTAAQSWAALGQLFKRLMGR